MTREDYNALRRVVEGRRTVRRYLGTPVPEEDLRRILDAARHAPSSGNEQPWKFLVVRRRETLDRLKAAALDASETYLREKANWSEERIAAQRVEQGKYLDGCFSAPVWVVVLVDREAKWPTYARHDGALAAMNLMLAARALGYGTIYGTDGIPERAARDVLRIPDRYEFVMMTPIGVPEQWPAATPRRDLETFLAYETVGSDESG